MERLGLQVQTWEAIGISVGFKAMEVDAETKGEGLDREGGLGHWGTPPFRCGTEERNQERRVRRSGNEVGGNRDRMESWKPREIKGLSKERVVKWVNASDSTDRIRKSSLAT